MPGYLIRPQRDRGHDGGTALPCRVARAFSFLWILVAGLNGAELSALVAVGRPSIGLLLLDLCSRRTAPPENLSTSQRNASNATPATQATQDNAKRRPAGFKMKRRHTTSSVAAFLSGVAAVLNIVLLASADVSVQPFRRASSAVARHLSPVELNEKILSSVPPPMITTSADDHAKTVRDQRHHQQRHHHHHHQERRYSHIAVFRRALSAASTRKQGLSRPGTVSALTTAANVAATICPPGMLPLGKNKVRHLLPHA